MSLRSPAYIFVRFVPAATTMCPLYDHPSTWVDIARINNPEDTGAIYECYAKATRILRPRQTVSLLLKSRIVFGSSPAPISECLEQVQIGGHLFEASMVVEWSSDKSKLALGMLWQNARFGHGSGFILIEYDVQYEGGMLLDSMIRVQQYLRQADQASDNQASDDQASDQAITERSVDVSGQDTGEAVGSNSVDGLNGE